MSSAGLTDYQARGVESAVPLQSPRFFPVSEKIPGSERTRSLEFRTDAGNISSLWRTLTKLDRSRSAGNFLFLNRFKGPRSRFKEVPASFLTSYSRYAPLLFTALAVAHQMPPSPADRCRAEKHELHDNNRERLDPRRHHCETQRLFRASGRQKSRFAFRFVLRSMRR